MNIKPELSKKNKYWISKHRYYELKHRCLQLPQWKATYDEICRMYTRPIYGIDSSNRTLSQDKTFEAAIKANELSKNIDDIVWSATEADSELSMYILIGVSTNTTYDKLLANHKIPCSRDVYYDRYRKFFWLLDKRCK